MLESADDSDLQRIEEQIALLFRRARSYGREAAADVHPDLSPAAYAILVRLVDCGPLHTAELIDHFGIDKAAISRQVKDLVDLGLAAASRDPDDRRAQIVAATPAGAARAHAAMASRRQHLRRQLREWTPGEVASLGELLAKFNELSLG